MKIFFENPYKPGDVVHGTVPTSLPLVEISHQRTLKRIQINDNIIDLLEGMLSMCSNEYQTQHILAKYFDSKCD